MRVPRQHQESFLSAGGSRYEDIRAEIYGDTAVTFGVFRIRETQDGKR